VCYALERQAGISIHDGLRFKNQPSEELSEMLLEKLSFIKGKSVFLNSGSEAVNLAITLAKHLTRRNKVLKLEGSYLAAYGYGQSIAQNTDLMNISYEDFKTITKIKFKEIAAFVFEPGNYGGLVRFPSKNFILEISNNIIKNGGLLIANEVTTGFGRTGKWFGFQHYDFVPDIVAVGKALGNGYPISGLSITKEVAQLFDKYPFRYAQSHQNDPLGCAVGVEVFKVIVGQNLIELSDEKGKYFLNSLKKIKERYPDFIQEVRGRGLMLVLVFKPEINVEKIYKKLLDLGYIVGQRENVLRFMPPLIIEFKEVDKLINAIDNIISVMQ
jgi:acetylornithine aminotransferase